MVYWILFEILVRGKFRFGTLGLPILVSHWVKLNIDGARWITLLVVIGNI